MASVLQEGVVGGQGVETRGKGWIKTLMDLDVGKRQGLGWVGGGRWALNRVTGASLHVALTVPPRAGLVSGGSSSQILAQCSQLSEATLWLGVAVLQPVWTGEVVCRAFLKDYSSLFWKERLVQLTLRYVSFNLSSLRFISVTLMKIWLAPGTGCSWGI